MRRCGGIVVLGCAGFYASVAVLVLKPSLAEGIWVSLWEINSVGRTVLLGSGFWGSVGVAAYDMFADRRSSPTGALCLTVGFVVVEAVCMALCKRCGAGG